MLFHARLEEVMSQPVVTTAPDAPALDALTLMKEKGISSLIIPTPDQTYGILTERGILAHAAAGADFAAARAGDLMTSPVACLPPSASVEDACLLLEEKGIRHLGVREASGAMRGVVSQTDLASALGVEYYCQNTLCSEIMTREVLTADRLTPLTDLAKLMAERRVSCLVVVKNQSMPEGIVSERDLTRLIISGWGFNLPAAGVMSSPVTTKRDDAKAYQVIMFMRQQGIRRVVLVDENDRLTGVLTLSDVIRGRRLACG